MFIFFSKYSHEHDEEKIIEVIQQACEGGLNK